MSHIEGSNAPMKDFNQKPSAAIDLRSLSDTNPVRDQERISARLDDTPTLDITLPLVATGSTMRSATVPTSATDSSASSASLTDTPDAPVAVWPLTHIDSAATKTIVTAAAAQQAAETGGDNAVPAVANNSGAAGPSGFCPVVAFASFAGQLSFKAILHLVVFGGGYRLRLQQTTRDKMVMPCHCVHSTRQADNPPMAHDGEHTDDTANAAHLAFKAQSRARSLSCSRCSSVPACIALHHTVDTLPTVPCCCAALQLSY